MYVDDAIATLNCPWIFQLWEARFFNVIVSIFLCIFHWVCCGCFVCFILFLMVFVFSCANHGSMSNGTKWEIRSATHYSLPWRELLRIDHHAISLMSLWVFLVHMVVNPTVRLERGWSHYEQVGFLPSKMQNLVFQCNLITNMHLSWGLSIVWHNELNFLSKHQYIRIFSNLYILFIINF